VGLNPNPNQKPVKSQVVPASPLVAIPSQHTRNIHPSADMPAPVPARAYPHAYDICQSTHLAAARPLLYESSARRSACMWAGRSACHTGGQSCREMGVWAGVWECERAACRVDVRADAEVATRSDARVATWADVRAATRADIRAGICVG